MRRLPGIFILLILLLASAVTPGVANADIKVAEQTFNEILHLDKRIRNWTGVVNDFEVANPYCKPPDKPNKPDELNEFAYPAANAANLSAEFLRARVQLQRLMDGNPEVLRLAVTWASNAGLNIGPESPQFWNVFQAHVNAMNRAVAAKRAEIDAAPVIDCSPETEPPPPPPPPPYHGPDITPPEYRDVGFPSVPDGPVCRQDYWPIVFVVGYARQYAAANARAAFDWLLAIQAARRAGAGPASLIDELEANAQAQVDYWEAVFKHLDALYQKAKALETIYCPEREPMTEPPDDSDQGAGTPTPEVPAVPESGCSLDTPERDAIALQALDARAQATEHAVAATPEAAAAWDRIVEQANAVIDAVSGCGSANDDTADASTGIFRGTPALSCIKRYETVDQLRAEWSSIPRADSSEWFPSQPRYRVDFFVAPDFRAEMTYASDRGLLTTPSGWAPEIFYADASRQPVVLDALMIGGGTYGWLRDGFAAMAEALRTDDPAARERFQQILNRLFGPETYRRSAERAGRSPECESLFDGAVNEPFNTMAGEDALPAPVLVIRRHNAMLTPERFVAGQRVEWTAADTGSNTINRIADGQRLADIDLERCDRLATQDGKVGCAITVSVAQGSFVTSYTTDVLMPARDEASDRLRQWLLYNTRPLPVIGPIPYNVAIDEFAARSEAPEE